MLYPLQKCLKSVIEKAEDKVSWMIQRRLDSA
jgi:hypothetical protein